MEKFYLTLDNEFIKYCELNNINDIEKFAITTFKNGFNIIKYGNIPTGVLNEKIVEKEVVREVIIEKPIEIIKEVSTEISNEEIMKLQEENERLRNELETITKSLESLGRKGKYMKDSNLSSLYEE
jgi:hypothetical protein